MEHGDPRTRGFLGRARALLPEGRRLPDAAWRARHRAIVALGVLHVPALAILGIGMGLDAMHSLSEALLVGGIATLSLVSSLPRRARTVAASLALVVASGIAVHMTGGLIEAHFHFFVMLAVIALYEDWMPFLFSVGYVAFSHGILGTIDPAGMYNHPDAAAHPWKWAFIHAGLVLAESVVLVAGWRIAESARSRVEHLMEAVGGPVFGLDAEGRVTFANPAAARLHAAPPERLLGRRIDDLLPTGGGDAGSFLSGAAGATRTGIAHVTPDPREEPRAFEWIRTPISRAGAVTGFVLTLNDVTARERSQASLERALSTMSATLDSTTDGILVIDRHGRVAGHNRRFAEIWGVPPELLDARDDAAAIAHVRDMVADPEAFERKITELYASPEATSFDLIEFRDGRIIERYSQPQRLGDAIIGRVWSFRDVTDRRRAEQAVLSSRVSRPLVKRIVRRMLDENHADIAVLMALGQEIARDADAADLPMLCRAYADMGLGDLRLMRLDSGRYVFEGRDLFEKTAASRTTTCHLALGFLRGIVARDARTDHAVGTEITCESRGDPTCHFIVQPRAPAGAAAPRAPSVASEGA